MPSLDVAAEDIAHGIASGWPDSDLVRVLAQAVSDFGELSSRAAQAAFLSEPRATGSRTWDAALAGLAVHLCREAHWDRIPDWTRDPDRYAIKLAWIGLDENSTLQAFVYQRTPAYFKARGVMLNAENLVSV